MKSNEFRQYGLSNEELLRQRELFGYNELAVKPRRNLIHLLIHLIREPMFILLLAAGFIYLLIGDPKDALMLLGFVVFTMGITIFQERKTERILDTLKDLASPRALVKRNGIVETISGREVVQGDLLVLEEGDRIAADGIILECHDLLLDESLLTGESMAVSKQAADALLESELFDVLAAEQVTEKNVIRQNKTDSEAQNTHFNKENPAQSLLHSEVRVFSGSMILQGGGVVRVCAIGAATELGKIGQSIQNISPEKSPLENEIALLVRRFAISGVALAFLVFVMYGITRQDWFQALLAGITLAMSMLPEEFAVILAVFMALGAWRISHFKVLTRHTPVIEALGSATVLCVDKTGTLTQNSMSLKICMPGTNYEHFDLSSGQTQKFPTQVQSLLEYAVLASEKSPFDPMDKAFHHSLSEYFPELIPAQNEFSLVHEYPLDATLLAMTHIWRGSQPALNARSVEFLIASKGAPESIAQLCRFSAEQTQAMQKQVEMLASQGMRVLAVAKGKLPDHLNSQTDQISNWPVSPLEFEFEWLGLTGLSDPVRTSVPAAVAECQKAGIRVVMITGDYPVTAQAIATEVGIVSDQVLSGKQLSGLSDVQLSDMVRQVNIFARILPDQKLRLVNALKNNAEVVAMTGDGVNDAPALKAAHIGISMGLRGTDVAREASSLVLLNDDFSSIVHAIRLGRRIYANLRKALSYVVAVHLPIAGMTLLPLLLGTPLVFAPIHIVFLEMIINPTCAIVFENEASEDQLMLQAPRSIHEHLFGRRNLWLAVLQGAGMLAAAALVFFGMLEHNYSEGQARAMCFMSLVLGNMLLIFVSRSDLSTWNTLWHRPNQAQWWILAICGMAMLLIFNIVYLMQTFHFESVEHKIYAIPLLSGVISLAWFELMKRLFKEPSD